MYNSKGIVEPKVETKRYKADNIYFIHHLNVFLP